MGRKLLIVNQNSGYLTIDVANAFIEQFDEVVVMFGHNRVTERDFHPRIKIQKTIKYDRSSIVRRLWTWGLCTLHLFFLLVWKYRRHHVVYYTNPPMSYFNALIFSNPFSVVVFDTYPDTLKLIGIKDTSFIYKIWVKINKQVFDQAIQIITLSEGMKSQLTHYTNENKIKVVPIWAASDSFKPIVKSENLFVKQNNWSDKFIILYSGNMGIGHKLEVLIDVAAGLKGHTDLHFLFVGEGTKKKTLMELVNQKSLPNVSFLTWQDSSVFPYSLAAGDIAVVALEPEATHASVPSKTFNYMAVGAPILGIGSSDSELEKIINQNQIGLYTSGNEIKEIENFILDLYQNLKKRNEFSSRAFITAKSFHYSLAKSYLY